MSFKGWFYPSEASHCRVFCVNVHTSKAACTREHPWDDSSHPSIKLNKSADQLASSCVPWQEHVCHFGSREGITQIKQHTANEGLTFSTSLRKRMVHLWPGMVPGRWNQAVTTAWEDMLVSFTPLRTCFIYVFLDFGHFWLNGTCMKKNSNYCLYKICDKYMFLLFKVIYKDKYM